MLKTKKLTVHYGPLLALHEISVEIKEGEMVALIGPNRAGKTTLLLTLSGILKTSEGRILFEEGDIANLDPHKIVLKGIGHVPQGRHIFPTLSVIDNLMMGAYLRKDKEEVDKNRSRVLHYFPVLAEREKQLAGSLSGGEQQMLAIGRAMMSNPNLLLLDEPSMGLSPLMSKTIAKIISTINQEGVSILLVEQNAKLALGLADKGYVLETGAVVLEGETKELLQNDAVKSAYLGG
jgi:branched-chain amino acid transport system ATP-binding protein